MERAIFAGGCFWCTEAVFQRVKGVEKVTSGFCGGNIKNPPYREVVQGRTGHAEAVEVLYDKEKVSFQQLMEVFMATHDPTTLNRQGYDVGTHYRSAIFTLNDEQQNQAESFVQKLGESGAFQDPIVTEIKRATDFYPAEQEHYDYYNKHRSQGYCQVIIDPKVKKLMTQFPEIAQE
ncbi:peptide-methionine (S)-S-oxide reductase [Nonlabens spongiae]|uniref:Peptide methionine sulfoxide reductase MsrA n=1 Tax=Nonlabens spongiae TaxID=331648 RepID=A0A1W6MN76_9FLAO|nr:peptide-methionine (S)-S-oxide reductase MsrA [Nonlabens spongiae]ARN79063.1 peptide-methionine (S)-S-oxide reductase [Nonlabens spongiae]